MNFMFFVMFFVFFSMFSMFFVFFCCFQGLDRVFLEIRSDRRYLYKDEKTM
ncbi:hypothetical protein LINGRAHAP2_LOCUS7826 [Linum grandiflorum]